MSVTEIYNQSIRPLPAAARLELAKLILNGISVEAVADVRDAWGEEDLRELSGSTWQVAPDRCGTLD